MSEENTSTLAPGALMLVGINTFHFTFAYGTDDTPGEFGDTGDQRRRENGKALGRSK